MTGFVVSAPPTRGARIVTATSDRVYLHPGQLAVAASECTLTTILGSCVAVCLHDPVRGVGGLNHFLLPYAPVSDPSTRYGNVATRRLLREMERHGARLGDLVAHVIGGACILDAYQARKSELGSANVRVALSTLEEVGITAHAVYVEGPRGRRVTFGARTGELTVKTL